MAPDREEIVEIDLEHCGVARAICAFAHPGEGWIVDPGPESTVDTLLAGLPEGWAPGRILLTHIHFDHAGATGRLLEHFPEAEVWVHEAGAKHLIDPARLVASATQIYGDRFDELWGEVVPVPAERVRVLRGDEAIDGWEVAYTPGHARHHVAAARGHRGGRRRQLIGLARRIARMPHRAGQLHHRRRRLLQARRRLFGAAAQVLVAAGDLGAGGADRLRGLQHRTQRAVELVRHAADRAQQVAHFVLTGAAGVDVELAAGHLIGQPASA